MKATSAPSARSAPATASAGTTCPAVPPAAITIFLDVAHTVPSCRFGARGVALRVPAGCARGPADTAARGPPGRLDGAQMRGTAGRDVEQQPHPRQHDDEAARAIGDE